MENKMTEWNEIVQLITAIYEWLFSDNQSDYFVLDKMMALWFLLLGVSSFLAWLCLNSRQWLLAWIWLPASIGFLAWHIEQSEIWIAIYFLSLCSMMMPLSGLFALIMGMWLPNRADTIVMEKWEKWDIKEMWRNPTPMRDKR